MKRLFLVNYISTNGHYDSLELEINCKDSEIICEVCNEILKHSKNISSLYEVCELD